MKKIINIIFSIYAVLMLLASTATAQTLPSGMSVDNDYQSGQVGYYYVNMPSVGSSKTITLTTNFPSSFKVYDNGGKNGNYKDGGISTLVLTAPDGYVFKLSGTITTEVDGGLLMDYLAVYDGKNTNARSLGDFIGATSGVPKNIGPVSSSDRYMTLMFKADKNTNYDGLDLTVTVVESTPATNSITVNTATGGNVTTDKTTARVNETVTLTATPSTGYLLKEIIVSDGSNTYPVTCGGWITNTATFTMPKKAVTVTPVFTTDWTVSGGLYTTMLSSGNLDANIPNGMQSFKVIFNEKIEQGNTSSLKITAPDGYLIQLMGKVSMMLLQSNTNNKASFCVYDGVSVSEPELLSLSTSSSVENQAIQTLSTGKSMYVSCNIVGTSSEFILDLTVTLIPMNTSHSVIVSNSISHGGVVTDLTSAKPQTKVSVTVTPDEGYVLNSINVTDANGNIILSPSSPNASFGDVKYYTESEYSFTMGATDATVSATFISTTDFYVRIPEENQRDFTIPEGTTSFKVYHTPWGGSAEHSDYYVNNNNGSLLLTAPEGCKMEVSGKAYLHPSNVMEDYLEIFDGNTNSATSFGKIWVSYGSDTYQDVNAQSSGNQLLLYFYSDEGAYAQGLDLQVTLIDVRKSLEGFSITIPSQTYNGSALTPVVTVQDGNTTLTEGTDYIVTLPTEGCINVGDYIVTITGKGSYKGTVEKTFKIVPKVTDLGALTLTEDQNGKTAVIDGAYTGADAFVINDKIEDISVTFTREFSNGTPSTIILPFAIGKGQYSGGTFYKFKGVIPEDGDWISVMESVEDVDAHTPYLFVPDGNTFEITGTVTIEATTAAEVPSEKLNGWTFIGVYQRKRWGAEHTDSYEYCFAANEVSADNIHPGDFVLIGQFVQIKPFRCYMTYDNGTSKAAPVLPENIKVRLVDGTLLTPTSEILPAIVGAKVWSCDHTIYIQSHPGTDYRIIDASGRVLRTATTQSDRDEICLGNHGGIAVVIINGKTYKINY